MDYLYDTFMAPNIHFP